MAATGISIFGAISASIALLDKFCNSLVNLRGRLKNLEGTPATIGTLVKFKKDIEKVVENIHVKLARYPPSVRENIASGVTDVFKDKVEQNIEDAATVLKKIEKYQDSSAGPSSRVDKVRKQVVLITKMKYVIETLDKAESRLDKALGASPIPK